MIGSGLKKLAAEYGMKVGHGIAYGNMGGFAASMSEGAGFKQVTFITKFTDPDKKEGFMQSINSVNINREFRVKDFAVYPTMIRIVFLDNPGTMDKLRAFVGWVIQLLQHFGATGINVCPECGGRRLRPELLAVTVGGKSIMEFCDMSIVEAIEFIDGLKLSPTHEAIAREILKEIRGRLSFLAGVGLDYLTLSRASATLSGGESQRIRLATQIGSGLVGVLYILD